MKDLASHCKRGMTITEFMVAMAAAMTVTMGFLFALREVAKVNRRKDAHMSAAIIQNRLLDMINDDCAWGNTFSRAEFQCVRDGNCVAGMPEAPIDIFDRNFTPFYPAKNPLARFADTGERVANGVGGCTLPFGCDFCLVGAADENNPSCPFRVDVTRSITCSGACATPQIQVNARFSLLSGRQNDVGFNASRYNLIIAKPLGAVYRSCLHARDTGGITEDRLVTIDPDGPGGVCALGSGQSGGVWCEMGSGLSGGWQLVINATGPGPLPVVSTISPAIHGKLSDEVIRQMLLRPEQNAANIRVEVGNNTVVYMTHTGGGAVTGIYHVNRTTACAVGADGFLQTNLVPEAEFSFYSTDLAVPSNKFIGYGNPTDGAGNPLGFGFYCINNEASGGGAGACNGTGHTCNDQSCCEINGPGRVWIRSI